jgi:hypothetical protein
MKKDKKDRSIEFLVRRISKRIPNSIKDIQKDLKTHRVANLGLCKGYIVSLKNLNRNHIFLEYLKEKYPGTIFCVFQKDYVRKREIENIEDYVDEKIKALPVSKFEEACRIFNLAVEDFFIGEIAGFPSNLPESRITDEKVTAYILAARTEFDDF